MSRLATRISALLVALALPGSAMAVQIKTSLTAVEADLMCVVCHEPLAVAQAPQADSERADIQMLIGRGETRPQIDRNMVAQYGPAVLAKPPAQGFALSLYILPPAVVALGLLILAITLPRWRRRAAARTAEAGGRPALALTSGEAQRLDDELRRYDG